jgi:hypothetical protein
MIEVDGTCVLGSLSGRLFSTREIAGDTIAAIADRRLTHYILFGISYRTALGTTVAHEIEARGLPPPDAVVLEGVLGRAFGADFPVPNTSPSGIACTTCSPTTSAPSSTPATRRSASMASIAGGGDLAAAAAGCPMQTTIDQN